MSSSSSSHLSSALDIRSIRAQFPALDRQQDGRPVAYFDGPGGTQVPRGVVSAMTDYLYHHNANTHWAYPTSVETDTVIGGARAALADFLQASPEEIAFGLNMTTLTFHLARALARGWEAGDEIIVTALDHHANVDPWRAAAKDRGLVVRTVGLTADGDLSWEAFQQALSPRTRFVAIGAASNALGTIVDLPRAIGLARTADAQVFVDAVHYAPHKLVDVRALDCDFLACSAYKFYGPHIGILYGKRTLIESLDVPKLEPAPEHAPDRIETGTQNHEGIAGAAAAVEFLASLGTGPTRRNALEQAFDGLHARGEDLVRQLWDGLAAIDGVTPYGRRPGLPRTPTVSFSVQGHSSTDVAKALAERGVFVSNGNFYAMTLLQHLGHAHDGLVRAGCACYTTEEEVERLVSGVKEIASGRP